MPKDWGSPHRCYFANTYFFMKLSGEGDMTGYRSPGPRPAPVFRSVICDCLSLNVPILCKVSPRSKLASARSGFVPTYVRILHGCVKRARFRFSFPFRQTQNGTRAPVSVFQKPKNGLLVVARLHSGVALLTL